MGIDYSKYRVLVVDDVKTNVLLLKVMLEQEKLQVSAAQDGYAALDILSKEKIDLLLLDVMMPGINGFDLAEKLKATPEFSTIPILFITALSSIEEIVKGFQLGGSDYITKPFNREELIARVQHQISLIHAKETILRQTEELRQAIEARDKLYAVIAHDLRSPIASLKMILNVLTLNAKESQLDANFTEMLDSGNEISEQVFSLLDNLLKWTKSQLGFLEPIFQSFNLKEIVSGVAEVLYTSAKLKKIRFTLNFEPIVPVSIDIDIMKTILRNLISNAIKFSYPNSTITISLKSTEHEAIVEVRDEGCGISRENQKKLLSRISRFTTMGTSGEEGTGLGLLISYQFIELHQGTFVFESEEGKGSCFGFRIPLLEEPNSPKPIQ
jgi:two-component system, sensor histidine kinase and response regulator